MCLSNIRRAGARGKVQITGGTWAGEKPGTVAIIWAIFYFFIIIYTYSSLTKEFR